VYVPLYFENPDFILAVTNMIQGKGSRAQLLPLSENPSMQLVTSKRLNGMKQEAGSS